MKILTSKNDIPIFKKENLSTNYRINLSKKEMREIIDSDMTDDNSQSLCETLEEIRGVRGVEYSGLLGPHIFLSVDLEDDKPPTWRKVYKAIQKICCVQK